MTDTEAEAKSAVQSSFDGSVLTLTLNRPDKGNALRHEDCLGLVEQIEAVDGGDDVRAILIRAEGKHFCLGADLVSANAGSGKPRPGHLARSLDAGAHRLVSVVWHSPVPTISLVRGRAMGLGLHLAVACDFTLASDDALFSEPFCKRGFSVDSGGSFLLPRMVGVRRARQMLLRGVQLPAATAMDWGLIDSVVDPDSLDAEGASLATELAQGPTYSLGHTKRLLNVPVTTGLNDVLAQEAASVEATVRSADFKEGLRAFAERRDPAFTGA